MDTSRLTTAQQTHRLSRAAADLLDQAALVVAEVQSGDLDCVTAWQMLTEVAAIVRHAADHELLAALEHGHTQAEFARAQKISKQSMHRKVQHTQRRIDKHLEEHR